MRLSCGLPLLAVLGAAWALASNAQECPRLALTAKGYPSVRQGILAGRKAKVTVKVQSTGAVQDMNFKVELPAGLSVIRTKTHPSTKKSLQPDIVENPDETTAIYWTDLDFKKNSKHVFRAEVLVDACAPETLSVTAFAYLVNATDLTSYCEDPLVTPVALRVRYPGDKRTGSGKHASSKPVTCAPTPAPSVNPATPFVPFGLRQRCLEAGRLAPFVPGRRLLDDQELEVVEKEYRHLAIATPIDCYNYCSIEGGVPAPFYFNWNDVTDQCYCCGGECTLILDPDFDAYKVVLAATGSPTKAPTPNSTPAPVVPCFNRDARVVMADGSYKPVHELRKGDLVSVDPHNHQLHAKVLALAEAPLGPNGGGAVVPMCELAPGFFLSRTHPLLMNGTRWIRPASEFACDKMKAFPSLFNIILEEGPHHTINIEGFALASWTKYPVGVPMMDRSYKFEMYRIMEKTAGFAEGHVLLDVHTFIALKAKWLQANPAAAAGDRLMPMQLPLSTVQSSHAEL